MPEPEKKVIGKCPHCGGSVIKEVKTLPLGRELRMGETAIAPTEETFHCARCKTMFMEAPPQNLKKSGRNG